MFVRLKKTISIYFVAGAILVSGIHSCSTDGVNGNPTSSEPQVKHSDVDTAAIAKPLREKIFVPRLTPRELLENFNYCRDNAETDFTCKFYIAKAICEYYGIEDFKKGETFIDFEKIHASVDESDAWIKLGEATDQDVLEKAQVAANSGKATIAVNINDTYGHVVLIVKGKLTKAHNWKGLMAPNCASFFMVKNMEPFVNKSMGYAFATPESVYLYTKK